MKKVIAQVSLSAIVLAITAPTAWAQTAAVRGQATLSDLSYSLVDLDAADGVAASIAFQPLQSAPGTVYIGELATIPNERNIVEDTAPFNLFANAGLSAGLPSGRAAVTVTNNSVAASAQLSMDDVEGVLREEFLYNGWSGYTTTAGTTNLIEPIPATPEYANFILSPYTSLVLEGTMDAQSFFETSSIDPALLAAAMSGPESKLYVDVGGELSLSAYLQDGTFVEAQHYSFVNHGFDASGWQSDGLVQEAINFRLELTNNTDQSQAGMLRYFAVANTAANLMLGPSIPEPATWASFALGLGFLGAAVARQRNRDA